MKKKVNWNEVETVLLDMDGTLLDLHFDNYFWLSYVPEVYSRENSLDLERATRDLHARFNKEKGTISWYCLDYWSNELKLDIAALKRDIDHKIAVRPHVDAFLTGLKSQDKKVVLLTNAHWDSLNLKMEKTGIDHHFDVLVSTHDYGLPKEEQGLWHSLMEDHPFEPGATLLVDDTESVLESARQFGIGHLLTIRQPDSMNPPRESLKFPAIDHFDEVFPHE